MDEIEKVSYNLEKPASKGTAHLAAKEIWRMALENIRLMGKKQAFIIVILLVTAVLLSVSTAEFVNTVSVDEQATPHSPALPKEYRTPCYFGYKSCHPSMPDSGRFFPVPALCHSTP